MMRSTNSLLSRRRFVQRCSTIAAAPLCSTVIAGQNGPPSGSLSIVLFKEFEGAEFVAVSPDSTRLCLYSFHHFEAFLKAWSYDGGNTKKVDDTLRVIELKTGNIVYATQPRSMVVSASFFASGATLYAETAPMVAVEGGRASTFQQVSIDLQTRKLNERLGKVGTLYFALAWPLVLGLEFSTQTSEKLALVLATLPDYREFERVPFAVTQEPERYGRPVVSGKGLVYGHDTMPVVSADRKTVAYGTGHSIVCRRASDLGLLWTRPIEPEYSGAWLLDLTPDGSKVAVAVVGGGFVVDRDKFYVGVYDCKNGSELARLALNGREGIAISPDGKLLAVSQQTAVSTRKVQPTVVIYDIAAGREVGKVTHPAVRVSGFGEAGHGAIGSRFTPDGKYLITSGLNIVKVWTIGGRR